jgi:multimeric flavodoxin WrbA
MRQFLIINGSPRKNGNSDYISNYIVDKFNNENIRFQEWTIREDKIDFCLGCEACAKSKKLFCVKQDSFSSKIDLILDSDGVLIISPVYQGGVTALVKNWMDRCEIFRKERSLGGKLCGAIAIGGYPGGGQELTLMQVQQFALITSMRYIASYGNVRSHFGGYCIAYAKQEISEDEQGLKTCENVVFNMINA